MQTFLPLSNLKQSATCLDNQRLNKQITEAWQIYEILYATRLTNQSVAYANHPAVLMWRGFEPALALYGNLLYIEWISRYLNHSRGGVARHKSGDKFFKLHSLFVPAMPDWWGNDRFHSAHRAILLAKNYDWYKQFGWQERPAQKENGRWPYWWPTKEEKNGND